MARNSYRYINVTRNQNGSLTIDYQTCDDNIKNGLIHDDDVSDFTNIAIINLVKGLLLVRDDDNTEITIRHGYDE